MCMMMQAFSFSFVSRAVQKCCCVLLSMMLCPECVTQIVNRPSYPWSISALSRNNATLCTWETPPRSELCQALGLQTAVVVSTHRSVVVFRFTIALYRCCPARGGAAVNSTHVKLASRRIDYHVNSFGTPVLIHSLHRLLLNVAHMLTRAAVEMPESWSPSMWSSSHHVQVVLFACCVAT
jgi:hypothetical protein